MNEPMPMEGAVTHDPFAGPSLVAYAPVTQSQREVWLACELDPDLNIGYNEGTDLRLAGHLDIDILRRSLQRLVQRHESLRVTFSPDGNWQCVLEGLDLELPMVEAGDLEDLETASRQCMRAPFDLERGPLIRFLLVRRAADLHHLLIVAHHLVCDGWSSAVLLTELAELYTAACGERAPRLADPPRYSDYAAIELEFLASEEGGRQAAYWLDRLRQPPPALDLPSSLIRPPQRRFDADRIDQRLPVTLVAALRRTAASQGASLVAMMMAGFSTLLHRLTGARDMVIGLAAAGQSLHQQEQLVGHCVNLLPLRLTPDAEQPFSEFLARTRKTVLDAADHQGITFGSLIPQLEIERDDSRTPLVSVLFNIDVRDDNITHAGLDVSYATMVRHAEAFEIFINVVDDGASLTLECAYATTLFSAEDIRRLLDRYQRVLATVTEQPRRPLGEIDLLDEAERHHVLFGLNPAATPVDLTPVQERVRRMSIEAGSRTAVTFDTRHHYCPVNTRTNSTGWEERILIFSRKPVAAAFSRTA